MDEKAYAVMWVVSYMVMGPVFWILAAFTGLLADWLWGDTFRAIMIAAGLEKLAAFPLWQLSAFAMFVGGFFFRPVPLKMDR